MPYRVAMGIPTTVAGALSVDIGGDYALSGCGLLQSAPDDAAGRGRVGGRYCRQSHPAN